MGYDGLFFWRNDYDDRNHRLKDNLMEMVWRPSPSLGPKSDLFTGILFYGYGPPPGFCYDLKCTDPPIQDDKRLFDYNVDERVESFIKVILLQAGNYRTDHVMFTMGSDFNHENSHEWYKNLDKLMKYTMMKEPRIKVIYSTPSRYLKAINEAGLSWLVKTDDFFPYADGPQAFWTGYFTSRPALKGYVRELNSLLQVCKQLEVMGTKQSVRTNTASTKILQKAMGVAQHHDAVSGTEKQHVANDYAKRLHIGQVECQDLIQDVIGGYVSEKSGIKPPKFEFCEKLNISVCNLTETSSNFDVIIYNPVARPRIALTRFPVNREHFTVTDDQGQTIPAQVVEVTNSTANIRGINGSLYELVIAPTIPPLGFKTFFVRVAPPNFTNIKSAKVTKLSKAQKIQHPAADITIENEAVQVTFDSINRGLKSITNKMSKISLDVHQGFYWYHAWGDEDSFMPQQRSGAYIFRPYGTKPFDVTEDGEVEQLSVVKGDVYMEVQQVFNSWISQSIRIFPGLPFVEFEYTVGPIPMDDHIGKEVISRFSTDLATDKTWYTDANGRQMQKRVRNYRPTWVYNNTEPIAGNYYPVNSRIYIRDDSRNIQFTVLNDRSQGGSSLEDGQLELMLHRRLEFDDGRGVDEPLSELGADGKGLVIRGHHIVLVDDFDNSTTYQRSVGEFMMLRSLPLVAADSGSPDKFIQNFHGSFSGLIKELPLNVHLLTLEYLGENKCLIRLEHQFEASERVWGSPVTVSLNNTFVFEVVSAVELGLGANTKLPIDRLHWITDAPSKSPRTSRRPMLGPDFDVELYPMEIRTFEVEFKFNQ